MSVLGLDWNGTVIIEFIPKIKLSNLQYFYAAKLCAHNYNISEVKTMTASVYKIV